MGNFGIAHFLSSFCTFQKHKLYRHLVLPLSLLRMGLIRTEGLMVGFGSCLLDNFDTAIPYFQY